ncbi:hypothetical protein [Noviherbaspirillum saxi]|uniref:hypothetical protein n=1 Tax=Noviherbaspirillum saxi TaxID=2320863 RepID=UPI0011C3B61D|nr:hypothetical protein [Noviherbaspirillum saxi]
MNPPVVPSDAKSNSGMDSGSPAGPGQQAAAVKGMLGNHKGKLAVGAAAMLGLAVYYKWRENRLAKEDPSEYARIQRLKAVVGSGDPKSSKTDTPQDRSDKQ